MRWTTSFSTRELVGVLLAHVVELPDLVVLSLLHAAVHHSVACCDSARARLCAVVGHVLVAAARHLTFRELVRASSSVVNTLVSTILDCL